jgi:5-methylcytosine-specific restriction endonuclease McrA
MGFIKSKKRNRKYPTGADNPRWLGGDRRLKKCQHCGAVCQMKPTESITTYRKRKFCSKPCADKGGFRYTGKDHPNYREEARRKNRGGSHHMWVNAVISRDQAICQKCGASNVELHAHHIKSYRDHPELRCDVSNGITLCFKCHWETHTALNANAVNSVNTLTDKAEGNTEPSLRGNLLEGVTTRGRASRKWVGECDFCHKVICKRYSDVKGKKALFCNGSCRSKWFRKVFGPIRKAVNSSKSAAPEREEIV